jgi:hypothetical protein
VQLPDNYDNILFTYGRAYYRLLSNAVHEVRINPVPHQTGYRTPSPSEKQCVNELLCYIWHTLAGPIHHYFGNPLLKYWFDKMDNFYTTASSFTDEDLGLSTDEPNFDQYDFYYNLEDLQEPPKTDDDTISNMQSPTWQKWSYYL